MRRKSKRTSGLCPLIVLTMLVFSGVFAQMTAAQGQKELTLFVATFDGWFQEVAANFEREHPDIKIHLQVVPNWLEVLPVRIASGVTPDLIGSGIDYQFWSAGVFKDLTPFIERDANFNLEGLIPALVDLGRIGDKLYGLPYGANFMAYYYNVDHYEQAGLESPLNLYQKGTWTQETFLESARRTTLRDSGEISRFGWTASNHDAWIALYLAMFGGGLLTRDGTEVLFDRPESIQAIDWWVSLNREHEVATLGNVIQNLASGRSSAGFHFMEMPARMQWDVYGGGPLEIRIGATAPYTITPGEAPVTVGGGPAISIAYDTPYPEEAWKFIAFMLSESQQNTIASFAGLMPVRLSSFGHALAGFQQTLATDAGLYADLMNHARLAIKSESQWPHYQRCVPGGICGLQNEAVLKAWHGNVPVQTALTQAAEQMRALIAN